MARHRHRTGPVSVVVDDGLEELANTLVANAQRMAEQAVNAELDAVEERLDAVWPKKTGRSRKAFERHVRSSGNVSTGSIFNELPHASEVRLPGGRVRAWDAVVESVTKERLARSTEEALEDEIRRGGR